LARPAFAGVVTGAAFHPARLYLNL